MSPNLYLQKLHALRAKKDTPHELTKLTKPRNGGSEGTKVGSVSFVSTQGVGFFDPEACNKSMPQEAKNTLSGHRQNRQNPYGCTLAALQARCPDVVPAARWQQAIEDGRRFLAAVGRAGRYARLDRPRPVRPPQAAGEAAPEPPAAISL